MKSTSIVRVFMAVYITVFFIYLFLPLVFMVSAAFNSSAIPSVVPWKGATLSWFGVLAGDRILWEAIMNSFIIGAGVVMLSIPIGLAGALLLTSRNLKGRSFLYSLMASPILTPGIILGISSLIFWDRFGVPGGIALTIIAQTTFIASFCMLMFMARLQRFDRTLEEAALDLGASHRQVFMKIMIPFLKPTFFSAMFIAFLQSFENYNTTLFVIGIKTTMTIRVASMVRLGLTPEINALAVLFISFTIVTAVSYEIRRRKEARMLTAVNELAKREVRMKKLNLGIQPE